MTLAQEHGIAVADFDPDTPIPSTKPARDDAAKAVKDPGPVAQAAREPKADGKVATAPRRPPARSRPPPPRWPTRSSTRKAGEPVEAGDVKDPEVRTAEQRNPDAATPAPDAGTTGLPRTGAAPASPAEAAGLAANEPAGDGKPAGDSVGNEEKK